MNENPTVPAREQRTSSARSTAPGEKRWYTKYHRSRNRPRALRRSASVKGATGRRSARSAPPELQPRKAGLKWSRRLYDPSLKNSWGVHRQDRTSAIEHHRPNASDRECCKGERQCGGGTGWRSAARADIARKPEGTWTVEGSREGSPGQRAHR